MNKIIIGFSRPKGWLIFKPFALIICLWWGTPFDHVYVRIRSDSYDRDIIYQASGTMVNFMSPVVFDEHNKIIREFSVSITDENKIRLMQFAIDNAGRPYGLKQGVGLGLIKAASWFGKKIKNPFGDGTNSWICSKLGGYILETFTDDNDPEINLPSDIDEISPKEVFEYLKALEAIGEISAQQPKQTEQP